MKVSEHFFCPEIDPAFARIFASEFCDRKCLRNKKEEEREDPEGNCSPSLTCDQRDRVDVDDGDDQQERQITEAKLPPQVRSRFLFAHPSWDLRRNGISS